MKRSSVFVEDDIDDFEVELFDGRRFAAIGVTVEDFVHDDIQVAFGQQT